MRVFDPPRKKIVCLFTGICKDLKRNQCKLSKKTQATQYGKLTDYKR